MIVDRLIQAVEASRTPRPLKPGAWNIGRCLRGLWAGAHGTMPTDPPTGRQLMTFDLGRRIEDAIMDYVASARIGHLRPADREDAVYVEWLQAHVRPDALLELERDMSWPDETGVAAIGAPDHPEPPKAGDIVVLEIKSMADYGFERALSGVVDDAYRAQCQVYMEALGCRWAVLLAYRKETSHLAEVWIPYDASAVRALRERAAIAFGARCPERPYQLEDACPGVAAGKCIDGRTPGRGQPHSACGGTGRIPGGPYIPRYPCGYCDYRTWCWGALEVVVHDGTPRWRPKEGV